MSRAVRSATRRGYNLVGVADSKEVAGAKGLQQEAGLNVLVVGRKEGITPTTSPRSPRTMHGEPGPSQIQAGSHADPPGSQPSRIRGHVSRPVSRRRTTNAMCRHQKFPVGPLANHLPFETRMPDVFFSGNKHVCKRGAPGEGSTMVSRLKW